ncbi:Integrin-linked kinase family protein [Rhynchospora pubera]|uniref:Integrin-linked kinase family protein n=1 Tax=Rhynchospora pubera TaxID=906938 RepID=A0AAV8CQM1_9POAL|nr:Integrin-linked kinase family protein [Rhynchospora pubera]
MKLLVYAYTPSGFFKGCRNILMADTSILSLLMFTCFFLFSVYGVFYEWQNIFRDNTNRLKVAGFGLIKMTKVSEDEYRFANPVEFSDNSYVAPEVYKNDVFGRGVDAFSFGLILYEMIEGAPAFYPKGAHEVVKMICLEGQRPPFKNKMKSYLSDSKELIQECWDPRPASRPTFSEIIARLSKMDSICVKQSRWKDNFKLPWK